MPVLSAAVSLLTPVGPGLFPAVLPRGLAGQVLLRVEPARLHQALGRHAGRHPGAGRRTEAAARRAGAVVRRAAARARGAVGDLLDAHRAGGGLPGRPLAAAAVQPVLGARPSVLRRERLLVRRRLPARAGHARGPGAAHRGRAPRHAVVARRRARRPARGHQGHRRQRLRRLPDVAVPPAGRGRARLRRPLHRRRARAERRHRAASGPAGSSWCSDTDAAYAVLPPGSPLAYNLREVEGWSVVEHSDDLELLQPPPGWMDELAVSRSWRRPSARACPWRRRSRRPRGPGRSRRPGPRRPAPPGRRRPPARRRR